MATLSKMGPGSFGMLFGAVLLIEWTIYASASYLLPTATVAQIPWPADISVISYLLLKLLSIQAQAAPFIGIIPSVLLGMTGGWVFGTIYNFFAKRLKYGIHLEFANGGSSLEQIGVTSYARVKGWATLLIYGAWIPLVGAAGATAGAISTTPLSTALSVIGTTAVISSVISFLSGMVFASAFNSAAELFGGIGIKLDREYEDTYTLKYINVATATAIMTMGYVISIASLMLIRGIMVETGILATLVPYLPQLEASAIIFAPILGLTLSVFVVLFYNLVVSRAFGLRVVLEGLDMEMAMEKNQEADQLRREVFEAANRIDRSKEPYER